LNSRATDARWLAAPPPAHQGGKLRGGRARHQDRVCGGLPCRAVSGQHRLSRHPARRGGLAGSKEPLQAGKIRLDRRFGVFRHVERPALKDRQFPTGVQRPLDVLWGAEVPLEGKAHPGQRDGGAVIDGRSGKVFSGAAVGRDAPFDDLKRPSVDAEHIGGGGPAHDVFAQPPGRIDARLPGPRPGGVHRV